MFDKYSNEFRDIDPRCLMTVLVALSLCALYIFLSLSLSFMLYIAARIFALLHISKSESAILSLIYLLHLYYSHSGITCREDRFVSFQQYIYCCYYFSTSLFSVFTRYGRSNMCRTYNPCDNVSCRF